VRSAESRAGAPIDLFLRCADALGDFVAAARGGAASPRPDLLGELDRLDDGGAEDAALEAAIAAVVQVPDEAPARARAAKPPGPCSFA